MSRTPRQRSRRRTYRRPVRGGVGEADEEKRKVAQAALASVKALLEKPGVQPDQIKIRNEASNFVVATYWWGKENVNKNLQLPCPEQVTERARAAVAAAYLRNAPATDTKFPRMLMVAGKIIAAASESGKAMPPSMKKLLEDTQAVWKEWSATFFTTEPHKSALVAKQAEILASERGANTGPRYSDRTFPQMIEEWESYCVKTNVNSVSHLVDITDRSHYQVGINAKPLFILQLLDVLKTMDPVNPKGVLYIDGDMWMHKYPAICDLEGIDFMARGWNIDPRAKEKALAKPFYDPFTLETSGGTMYFGNTEAARKLLRDWAAASEEQIGKADDRILSQVFTMNSTVVSTNVIQLPIEYLWLTDLYASFTEKLATAGTSIEKAIIEHPYCLTGEERAADQGAAQDRGPANYEEQVVENIQYNRDPEVIYEYIFTDGKEAVQAELAPYFDCLRTTTGFFTGKPLVTLVPFDQKYGTFTETATKNLSLYPSFARPTGTKEVVSGKTAIGEILTALKEGHDVWTNEVGTVPTPEIEMAGVDISTKEDNGDQYTSTIQIDTTKSIFFSAKSPMVRHLLLMCEELKDLNTHLKKSYFFLSRIRWSLTKPADAPPPPPPTGMYRKIVNQVWFGPADPGWRQTLFDKNKALCEANGYVYKLWKEVDRTEENFEITFAYQETAREKGPTRWAQVADLARLEILYNTGGIYVDSIVELSPALFLAVEKAMPDAKEHYFVGCNEDPCDPFGTGESACKGTGGKPYLTNSFFATTRANPVFKRLLDFDVLDAIDMDNNMINETTGPYFLRTMITDPAADHVTLLDSSQIFQFNQQPTQSKKEPVLDRFISATETPGSIKVKDGQYFTPGGIEVLQREFLGLAEGTPLTAEHYQSLVERKGPLATYHSGLGGTWSPT